MHCKADEKLWNLCFCRHTEGMWIWIVRYIVFMIRYPFSLRFSGWAISGFLLFSLVLAGCGAAEQSATPASNQLSNQQYIVGTETSQKPSGIGKPSALANNITVNMLAQPMADGSTAFVFTPASVAVLPGTTVIWKNMTGMDQTLVSPVSNVFIHSKVLKNSTYKMTFMASQAIAYFSKEHPEARGTLLVQAPRTVVTVKVMEKSGTKGETYSLSPAGLVIKAGTVVTWENQTNQNHVLTSDKGNVFSVASTLVKNGSYKTVFSKPGTFIYYSKMFPETRGVIVVVS
jgi:plastocyanin